MNKLMLKLKKQLIFVLVFLLNNLFSPPRYMGLGPETNFNPSSGAATQSKSTAFSRIYSKLLDLELNQFEIDHNYWIYKEGHDEKFTSLNIVWNPSWQIKSDSYSTGSRRGWWDHRHSYPEFSLNTMGMREFYSDPASLKFYMGVLFGRLYFVRTIFNNHIFNETISNANNYIFNKDSTKSTRFFVNDKLNEINSDNASAVNTSNILSKCVKKTLPANKNKVIAATSINSPVMIAGDSILTINDISANATFDVIDKNRYEGSYLPQINSFYGIADYRISCKFYDNGKIGDPDSDMKSLRSLDYYPQNPFILDSFVDKYHIPVLIPENNYALMINLLGQVNVIRPEGTQLNIMQPACSNRAACLDVAASKNYIAFVGVGRNEPADNNVTIANFDPYDGSNYFFYLKVSKTNNIGGLNVNETPLNAARGKEGQSDETDPRVFCCDKDFAATDGFINFVSFDSVGNLFILTSLGKLYFYTSDQLATDGKKMPKNIPCAFQINSISGGKGLVASDLDGKLFYLSTEDILAITKQSKITTIPWQQLPDVFQSQVYCLLQSGELLFIRRDDNTNIYVAKQEDFLTINIESLFSKITGTDVNSYKLRLQLFCHLVLNRQDRIYGGLPALAEANYPLANNVDLAIMLINKVKLFFGNIPDSAFESNPALIEDVSLAINALKTNFGSLPAFSTVFDSFQSSILQNKYFQDRSFRQKLKKLDVMLKANNSTDLANLKTSIDDLISNSGFLNNNSGFNNLSELLASTAESTVRNRRMGASIILEWIRLNKTALLLVSGITDVVHAGWISILFKIEKNMYLNTGDVGTAQGSLSDIATGIKLLEDYQLKDSLIGLEKTALLEALQNIVSTINFLTFDELSQIKEKLTFLNVKFKLDQDGAFNVSKKNIILDIFYKLKIDFGVQYFIAQFKAMVANIADMDQTKTAEIQSLVAKVFNESFKQIIKLKADFELKTLSNKDVSKAAFINYISDLIIKDKNFKAYEDKLPKTGFNEDSFATQLVLFKDDVTIKDFINIFGEWSKLSTEDIVGNNSLKTTCKKALEAINAKKPYLLLSFQDANSINGNVETLLNKGVLEIVKIDQKSFLFDFQTFLNNLILIINSNKDSNSKCWDLNALSIPKNNNLTFFNFIKIIQDYQKFNPDFSNDNHKFGFLSILNYIKKSIIFLKQNIDQASISFIRLDVCLNTINSILGIILGDNLRPLQEALTSRGNAPIPVALPINLQSQNDF